MIITYINNKSSSFIAQVSIIPYGWTMKVPSICCTKGYTT